MIWGSQVVLEMLAAAPAGLSYGAIVGAVIPDDFGLTDRIGRLRRRKLIELVARRYRLTAAGRAFLADGRRFTSGSREARTGKRLVKNTLRGRAWHAIRIRIKFSLGDILERAARGDEGDAESNIRKYLRILARTGFLSELPTRQRGETPGGAGWKRYLLVRNSGPQAPRWLPRRGIVYDPNTEEEHRP